MIRVKNSEVSHNRDLGHPAVEYQSALQDETLIAEELALSRQELEKRSLLAG